MATVLLLKISRVVTLRLAAETLSETSSTDETVASRAC